MGQRSYARRGDPFPQQEGQVACPAGQKQWRLGRVDQQPRACRWCIGSQEDHEEQSTRS